MEGKHKTDGTTCCRLDLQIGLPTYFHNYKFIVWWEAMNKTSYRNRLVKAKRYAVVVTAGVIRNNMRTVPTIHRELNI